MSKSLDPSPELIAIASGVLASGGTPDDAAEALLQETNSPILAIKALRAARTTLSLTDAKRAVDRHLSPEALQAREDLLDGFERAVTEDDRRAIEVVAGHSVVGGVWPAGAMPPGTRVQVVKDDRWDGPWRDEFEGMVDATIDPQLVDHDEARAGELMYSIVFDESQLDATGDGPYRKAVIWDRYLRRLSN